MSGPDGALDGRSQLLVYHFMFGPSYEAGAPVNSSMVDGFDGLVPHLHARDLTLMLVSRARRWRSFRPTSGGWAGAFPGPRRRTVTSTSTRALRPTSRCASRCRGSGVEVDPAEALEGLPPIAHQNAAACGTDVPSYICESPMVSAFALEDGAVYQTYTTTWRGLEFTSAATTHPRPRVEGTRRGRRRMADLDSPPRRV